jgi:hypothetical protein
VEQHHKLNAALWRKYSVVSPFEIAKKEGYSDEEIHEYLSKKEPKYTKAIEEGYSPEQISNFLSQKKLEKPSFETDEDLEREIERSQAQFTSRMLERFFGTPGNIYQMLPKFVHKANPLHFLHKRLPTEQQLRSLSQKITHGYTAPKTELEEKVGEFGADISSFALGTPGKTLLGGLSRVVGIPLAGQIAKEGVEKLGGGRTSQEYTKLGTMFLMDLWGLKKGVLEGGAYKYGINRLEQAKNAIPKDALADVSIFQKKLTNLEKGLKSGVTGPHTNESLRTIEEIRGHIKNGQMEAWRFPKIREDINKLIDNLKGFSVFDPIPTKIKKASIANLNQVKSALIQAGNRWGRGNSPEFFQNWREGNEALAVYQRSNDFGRFFARKTKINNQVLRHLLGAGLYHHPFTIGGLAAAKKGLEIGTRFPTAMAIRFFSSKVLRKLYEKVLAEAARSDVPAAAATIKNIEKEMGKEQIQ